MAEQPARRSQTVLATPPLLHRGLHSAAIIGEVRVHAQMEMELDHRTVAPVRPAAGYIGGKKQLARALVARIEAVPHDTYAEPFVGMGGVFFRRRFVPKGEIVNDRSGDVATFFRVLQRHYVAFMDMLKWQLSSRREFEPLKASDPATLTDLERAARFLYLQRTAFGGKVAGRNFGVDPLGGRFNITKLAPMLEDLHERLAGVVIECLAWPDFIARYDRPGTLFFLDSPYWGSEADYGEDMFSRDDYAALAEALNRLQGRFIMTLNDVAEVRRTFAGFAIQSVPVTYTVTRGDARRARELIITGPPSPNRALDRPARTPPGRSSRSPGPPRGPAASASRRTKPRT